MIRPSSLNQARHCQLSAVLSARYPSTNANIARGQDVDAQVSAWVNGGPEPLDPAAVEAVAWLKRHVTEARAQVPCVLLHDGSDEIVTHGTCDVVGVDSWDPGVLIVVDLKKREQWIAGHVPPPDENLQLHAYALAQVEERGMSRYRVALLLFGEADIQNVWSKEYTPETWAPIKGEIENICAQKPDGDNDPIGVSGAHCTACYSRLHCPAWTLKGVEGDTALAALSAPAALTPERAGRAYLAVKAMRELADRGEEILKAYQRQTGPGSVVIGEKEWRPITQQGRKSADVAALERAGLTEYVKQGPPFETWRLTKLRSSG